MKKVFGLTIIALLIFSCSDKKKEIIGKWTDDSQYGVATIIIYRKGNTIYLENRYGNAISGTKEMTAKEVEGQLRYIEKEGGDLEKYYVINSHNNLEVYDDQGVIRTFKRKE